jgi:PST family polysaccharide transporter
MILHVALALTLASALYFAAPLIVHLVLGRGYEPVVPLLTIMAMILPLFACTLVMGYQYMLPLGMDRQFTGITIAAGGVNLLTAVMLVPTFAELGMAYAVLATQLFVTLSQFVSIMRRAPQSFFSARSRMIP